MPDTLHANPLAADLSASSANASHSSRPHSYPPPSNRHTCALPQPSNDSVQPAANQPAVVQYSTKYIIITITSHPSVPAKPTGPVPPSDIHHAHQHFPVVQMEPVQKQWATVWTCCQCEGADVGVRRGCPACGHRKCGGCGRISPL